MTRSFAGLPVHGICPAVPDREAMFVLKLLYDSAMADPPRGGPVAGRLDNLQEDAGSIPAPAILSPVPPSSSDQPGASPCPRPLLRLLRTLRAGKRNGPGATLPRLTSNSNQALCSWPNKHPLRRPVTMTYEPPRDLDEDIQDQPGWEEEHLGEEPEPADPDNWFDYNGPARV